MKNIKKIALSLAALILLSGAVLAVPAHAHEDNKQDDNNTSERSRNRSGASNSGHDDMDDNSRHSKLAEQIHREGDDRIKSLREQNKQRSQAERQKSCINRKEALNKRMNQKVAHAERHKAYFDKVFSRVKNYHDTNQLSVASYDALVTSVDSAQAKAQANIDALKALDVDINCSSQNIGDNVSAFQQAVKSTRDALKEYRTSLHNLLKAVRQAAEDGSTSQQ